MRSIGFLHTSPVHEPTFAATLRATAGSVAVGQVHVVDESLLADARAQGMDEALRGRIREHVRRLAGRVDVIVCTCSTISGEAERLARMDDLVLVRIDRPMAERAVRTVAARGGIGVAAAVASTIEPTRALLTEVAAALGVEVTLVDIDCSAAWPSFEHGDMPAYHSAIALAVRTASQVEGEVIFDVVVLAQASMAGAVSLLEDEPYPVLSSPQSAVEQALHLALAMDSGLVDATTPNPPRRTPSV